MELKAQKEVKSNEFTLGLISQIEVTMGYRVLYQLDLFDRDCGDTDNLIPETLRQLGFVLVYSDEVVGKKYSESEFARSFLFYEDLRSSVRDAKALLRARMKRIYKMYDSLHTDLLIEEEAYFDCMFQDIN